MHISPNSIRPNRRGASRGLNFSGRSGMTLMEIMVVIAIIGTIATVVAVNVFGIFSQSNVQNTKLQMGTMHEAMGIYKVTHGQRFPKTLEEAQANFAHSKVPTDAWGGPFSYQQEDGGRGYTLSSLGEDAAPGGEGTDADIVSKSGVISD
jgi:general secretion pathway protein G